MMPIDPAWGESNSRSIPQSAIRLNCPAIECQFLVADLEIETNRLGEVAYLVAAVRLQLRRRRGEMGVASMIMTIAS